MFKTVLPNNSGVALNIRKLKRKLDLYASSRACLSVFKGKILLAIHCWLWLTHLGFPNHQFDMPKCQLTLIQRVQPLILYIFKEWEYGQVYDFKCYQIRSYFTSKVGLFGKATKYEFLAILQIGTFVSTRMRVALFPTSFITVQRFSVTNANR